MYELFEIILEDCIRSFEEVDKNEFCKNKNNQRKPVLLSGRK